MTITNSNATALTANPFTFFYLAGLVNAAVPNATSTCSGASITATAGTGSYNQTTSFTIPPLGSCSFSSTVTTATPGTYTGSIPAGLIVTPAGSSGASSSVTLIVTAAPTPAVTLTPPAVAFGARTVNTTSPVSVVTLTNSGTANLVISSITGSGDFGFTTTCPISTPPLVALANCTINITFTPLTVAALTGNITIASNAPGSPHVITLSGTGAAVAVPGVTLSAAAFVFGNRQTKLVKIGNRFIRWTRPNDPSCVQQTNAFVLENTVNTDHICRLNIVVNSVKNCLAIQANQAHFLTIPNTKNVFFVERINCIVQLRDADL